MQTRRNLLIAGLGVPAMLTSTESKRGYTFSEIEKMIAENKVDDRLTIDDIPTPALVLDLEAFQLNIIKMIRHADDHKKALRPHAKTHKCPEVARVLNRAGAVGACAAKISEAEVLAKHDIPGLLLTSAMVGKHRIERALRLAKKQPDTIFSVDDAQNARDLNDAAHEAGIKLNVAIDLLVGRRTGIQPGEPAVELARVIDKLTNLKLKGIQAYSGGSSHVVGFEERKKH